MEDIGTGLSGIGLSKEIVEALGGADEVLRLANEGKFKLVYNGAEKIWKLNFYGNQSVSSELVSNAKASFLSKARVFKVLKAGGAVLGVASTGLSLHLAFTTDDPTKTIEHTADAFYGGLMMYPGGQIPGGIYYITKWTGLQRAFNEANTELIRSGLPAIGSGCFIKGSRVLMRDGYLKNIENVKVGDTVKTMNINTFSIENHVVQQIFKGRADSLVEITFNKNLKNINSLGHPYYVKDKGWCSYKPTMTKKYYNIKVSQLEKGDICICYENGILKEVKITSFEIRKRENVYNLSKVAGNNNYFVNGILVHNKD